MSKYSLDDLHRISKQYRKNFKKILLLEKKGMLQSKEHNKLIEIEKVLNNEDVKCRKALKIWIPNPCPLSDQSYPCKSCTGYYAARINNKKRKVTISVRKETESASRCELKFV